jgi:hypothetical protein
MVVEKVRRGEGGHYPHWIQRFLNGFINHIDVFPVPWGIRLATAVQGFRTGQLR